MTHQAILLVSCLLLAAFGSERLSKRTGIPAVVVLIALGMLGKPALEMAGVELTGVNAAVSLLGTVGLVLIVLEGAFDLELRRERMPAVARGLVAATVGFMVCCALYTALGMGVLGLAGFDAFLLSVPFSVISSAVAIPSSRFLPKPQQEFVVYESSISDIVAILVFFAALNSDKTWQGVLSSLLSNGLMSVALGSLSAVGLLYILKTAGGHVRFIPLLASLFALYAIGKLLHLSPLIMVLIFGLVLNNPNLVAGAKVLRNMVSGPGFSDTVREFKSLTAELTFAVRGVFFVLLGYWTDLHSVWHWAAWLSAVVLLVGVYGPRRMLLRFLRVEHAQALTWLAPRGLISVLLYFSAKDAMHPPEFVDGALTLVVLASAILISRGRTELKQAA